MYIVVWSDTLSVDHWAVCETLKEARRMYENIKAQDHIYTVSVAAVAISTDYDPSCSDDRLGEIIEELQNASLILQADGAHLQNAVLAEPMYQKAEGLDEAVRIVRGHLHG